MNEAPRTSRSFTHSVFERSALLQGNIEAMLGDGEDFDRGLQGRIPSRLQR